MRACRSVLLALLVLISCATGGVAIAAEQSAQDFLGAIYATYKGKDAKGIDITRRGAPARYFSPSLARLIDADARAAAKRREVMIIGADPFINAQDFEISVVTIAVAGQGADKAVGTVRFKNFDQDEP